MRREPADAQNERPLGIVARAPAGRSRSGSNRIGTTRTSRAPAARSSAALYSETATATSTRLRVARQVVAAQLAQRGDVRLEAPQVPRGRDVVVDEQLAVGQLEQRLEPRRVRRVVDQQQVVRARRAGARAARTGSRSRGSIADAWTSPPIPQRAKSARKLSAWRVTASNGPARREQLVNSHGRARYRRAHAPRPARRLPAPRRSRRPPRPPSPTGACSASARARPSTRPSSAAATGSGAPPATFVNQRDLFERAPLRGAEGRAPATSGASSSRRRSTRPRALPRPARGRA